MSDQLVAKVATYATYTTNTKDEHALPGIRTPVLSVRAVPHLRL
jgi:hypothetical protein